MTFLQFILASLWHHRRIQLAVVAGVAIATAVITGALLVGDSVRGSLRGLALEGLGHIDTVLVAEQPFRAALADELLTNPAAKKHFDGTAPLLLVPGTLSSTGGKETVRRATQLSIIGHDARFWQFGSQPSPAPLAGNECAITRSIATELNVAVGDEVLLRLPLLSNVPADSTLGEKAETTTTRRLEVAAILPNQGLARFILRPSQQSPRNVFVPLATLQKTLDLNNKINLVAIGTNNAMVPSNQQAQQVLRRSLKPALADFNIRVEQSSVFGYLSITADRLVLAPALVAATQETFPAAQTQPAITYLANTITLGKRKIPYSIVTGIDSNSTIGPLLDEANKPLVLADDEIVLNDWAANDLQAAVGDTISITYYEPETTHGRLREAAPLELRLRAIVPLQNSDGSRTAASDPQLTPTLPGVTDQGSISDWELPFELVETIRSQDEDYWDQYTTTPKAFVSYSLAQRLWKTRWGSVSVLRLPVSKNLTVDVVQQQLHPEPADMGMTLLPVKQQGLQAARGTTSFEGLFLGFSFFLVASALLLIALLVRLGVEGRAAEVGVLSAIGWSVRKLQCTWMAEAAVVALVGATLGAVAGIGYARLMIHGLSTWWVAATVTPFLKLHVPAASLLIGYTLGVVVALATIWFALRKLVKLPARQLMAGDCTSADDVAGITSRGKRWLPPALLAAALAIGLLAFGLQGEAQAGAFFGGGALVLTGLLTWLRQTIRRPATATLRSLSLAGLATRNARRNPSRTILSVGLAAVASFLIVALSAFRLAPTEQGTGGFDLIATADQPIHFDLNTSAGREELGFGDRDDRQFAETTIHGFRVHQGEDASCLNLYQTSQPTLVGIPRSFYSEDTFGWAAAADYASAEGPWHLLDSKPSTDSDGRPAIPVVLDKNTATYSLHLSGIGATFSVRDALDRPVTLQVVGLLAGSVLQGKVLVSEANLVDLFPENSGQQLFLIRSNGDSAVAEQLATLLESQLEDYGFDAVSTQKRLADFLAVQNTYLSTFQSLGALGLLLGALGLAVAQLRSVLERRGELALLRSVGFRGNRLAEMVLGENVLLLLSGLAVGCFAALVAVLPHWLLHRAETPWQTLGILLLAILATGLAAGWLAVRAALRAPLLSALRGE